MILIGCDISGPNSNLSPQVYGGNHIFDWNVKIYFEVLGNYSHWNLNLSERFQVNPSVQWINGVLGVWSSNAPIEGIIYIQWINFPFKSCTERRWDFFNIRKKLFTIHHYTTAITSVSIKMSKVWEYYEKISKDEAKCLLCKKVVSCKASSTTGPIRHLKGNY